MQYGQKIITTKYEAGKVITEQIRLIEREKVADDSEELAKFIQFQREHKNNVYASITREINSKGTRYVIKEWNDK